MDRHFRDLPDFHEVRGTIMTASAAHAPTHIPAFNQLQRNLSANDVPGLYILVRQCSMLL